MPEIDVQPMRDHLARIEEEMESPVPTPPVGTVVVWYDRADIRKGNERAAIVTRVEEPGKLTLTIFPPNGMPIHKQGSLHVSNSIHEQRNNAVSKNSGAWDYPQFADIPKGHFSEHLEKLADRKESLERKIQEAEQVKKASSTKPKTRQTKQAASTS